jgi:hypothetical protein
MSASGTSRQPIRFGGECTSVCAFTGPQQPARAPRCLPGGDRPATLTDRLRAEARDTGCLLCLPELTGVRGKRAIHDHEPARPIRLRTGLTIQQGRVRTMTTMRIVPRLMVPAILGVVVLSMISATAASAAIASARLVPGAAGPAGAAD